MRQAGTLSDETSAQRFVDYLLTLGINAKADPDGDHWAIWIHEEGQLARGKQELAEFLAQQDDAKYATAATEAAKVRREQTRKVRQAQRNYIEMRDRWNRPPGEIVITLAMIVACVVIYVVTREGRDYAGVASKLYFAETVVEDGELKWPINGFYNIEEGQVWRLVTPSFMHGSFLHLLFNMMWLYDLGGLIEVRRGRFRYVLLVLVTAALSNAAQCWMVGPLFLGMSGVVSGLFGYVWMKSKYDPGAGLYMTPNTVIWMIGFLLLCTTGVLGPVANTAHGVGLITGMLIGIAPKSWRL